MGETVVGHEVSPFLWEVQAARFDRNCGQMAASVGTLGSLNRMPARLLFADAHAAQDALTFASRAARLTEDAVRLQASGGTLAMTAAPLAPRGLMDATPTVLGMRALRVDPELVCDLVVPATSLVSDAERPDALDLPDAAVSAAWAGVAPPRAGWSEGGQIDAATLASRAQWGIQAVAEQLPTDPGEDIVRTIRFGVWAAADDSLEGLPLGTAFAAFALGFIAGEESARVFHSGSWTRVSLSRGHVLVRRPVRMGMTAVRTTG